MNRGSTGVALLVAVISGMLASVSVVKYVKQMKGEPVAAETNTVRVVVAKSEIPAGTPIRLENLGMAVIHEDAPPEGCFSDAEAVEGRVTTTAIYPGEIILGRRLTEKDGPSGLPAMIPENHRAIAIRVDDTIGVAGFIQPGHRVDVVSVIDVAESGKELVSKVILQNILVLAAGSEAEVDEANKARAVPTVTVLVTLEQAERLSLATNAGKICLVLRSATDKGEEPTEGVTLASLVPQANQDALEPAPLLPPLPVEYIEPLPEPEPAPAEDRFRVVEVYRGVERSEVSFKGD